jgi:acetyl esterase/lipase
MALAAYILAFSALIMSGLMFLKVRSTAALVIWFPKAMAGSAVVFVGAAGALGAILGLLARAPVAVAAGVLGALLSVRYVRRVAAPHDGFERAFGPDWMSRIGPEQGERMLGRRWVGRIPAHRGVRWTQDLPFWTVPGTDRELLCDLWRPPEGQSPSGLAFIYLHGGAWHFMDKDLSTRTFFRHLAAQGHVVMDVAYRLCPEVDLRKMVGDAKRAVVWMKANAERYGVDPARVVVAGGSSGGHLALLAAYAPDHPDLTPADVAEVDRSVRAAVAYYPGTDLRAGYHHYETLFGGLMKAPQPGKPNFLFRAIGRMSKLVVGGAADEKTGPAFSIDRMMGDLLGGTPAEVPEAYQMASPISHVGPACPPTLILQGEDDPFQPVGLSRALHDRLTGAGVPSVLVVYPQTEHGFDLLLPRYAPAAQAALYEVDRFLALMV